jgi:hypothetical protein
MILCALRRLPLLGLFLVVSVIGPHGARGQSSCPCDVNGDGQVTVNELIQGVNASLEGCPPPGPDQSTLVQTGQTQCDQGSGTLGECPGSPPGQDGEVGAGQPFAYTDNGDGTVTDNRTKLMWEKLSDDSSVHDRDTAYTWQDAFDVKIAALNTQPCFAGRCDWRLPNRRELDSLVDAGRVAPAVDAAFNTDCIPRCTIMTCSCTQLDYYWTSTTYQDLPTFAWAVDCNTGIVNAFEKIPDIKYPVRAVRGGL